jgi:hypothetical protein
LNVQGSRVNGKVGVAGGGWRVTGKEKNQNAGSGKTEGCKAKMGAKPKPFDSVATSTSGLNLNSKRGIVA